VEHTKYKIRPSEFSVSISAALVDHVRKHYIRQVDLTSTTKLHYKTYLHGGELVVAGRVGKKAQSISAEVSSVSFDTNKIYITTVGICTPTPTEDESRSHSF